MDIQKSGLSRRTVIKGAAWSVPLVAAAVAVPARAASAGGSVAEQFDFYLTAGEVIGNANAAGSVRSNGVRISPTDPSDPKVVAAGTVFTVTLTYTGSNPGFSFLNTPYGVDWMKAQNPAWPAIDVTANTVTFSATTAFASTEPTIGSYEWLLDPAVRPEDNSLTFTGTVVLAPGGDFPDGGTLVNMIVDPNLGTGSLAGPTPPSWPEA
ncbi:hypothetical protein GCM10025768_19410 [Microbacterium pseudoresistens]|uniref:Uncharacterized protein n=1 Tax=Microbacterium pseudoresistens TaxID=640634 RepID=A0A7Y9EX83_9MICO|nr:hypothetical protein [Microbacterium pseudoresistens]NYD55635.1 hypothetical protein [Microbacterium pseudoresistens]